MTPDDEWDAIALNYTSGTTGNPKGVVYHHRGAYLNALGNILVWGMRQHPVYLWTLPMFHCNGWCFPWTVTALAGTHVCLRRVEAGGDLRGDRARRHHPSLRRAGGHEHAAECRGRAEALARAPDRDDDRRGAAARRGHRGHGGARLSHHPCLRPDRGLWPRRGLRLARRVGRAARRRAGAAQGAPGRHLPGARRPDRRRPGDPRAGRRPTARRWARS